MRLGAYQAHLKEGTLVHQLYQACSDDLVSVVHERHRHRYEVNPTYVPILEKHGFICSGHHVRPDETVLMEFAELAHHPFFVATQAHPEFKSRLGNPNPLFLGFVKGCVARQDSLELASGSYRYAQSSAPVPDIQEL